MNRPDLYHKTVDILFDAYFNDTLKHSSCTKCAVGNIVAANMNLSVVDEYYFKGSDHEGCTQFITKSGEIFPPYWQRVFVTRNGRDKVVNPVNLTGKALEQINATGYPWQELARIEYAFETAPRGSNAEDYMFNGLVAVLDVLKQLHEIDDNAADIARFEAHRLARCI